MWLNICNEWYSISTSELSDYLLVSLCVFNIIKYHLRIGSALKSTLSQRGSCVITASFCIILTVSDDASKVVLHVPVCQNTVLPCSVVKCWLSLHLSVRLLFSVCVVYRRNMLAGHSALFTSTSQQVHQKLR